MSEQKTNKNNYSGTTTDIFKKDIEIKRSDGSIKEIDSVVVSKWVDGDRSSIKMKISVTPIGYSRGFLKFDATNLELREAIETAYKKVDTLLKK